MNRQSDETLTARTREGLAMQLDERGSRCKWRDGFCPVCACPVNWARLTWCPICHPGVVEALHLHCDRPHTPPQERPEPSPPYDAEVDEAAKRLLKLKRRVRHVRGSVPDGVILADDRKDAA